MTNPSNVAVITDKLIAYLRTTRDDYIRSDLVAKITQLAERFAPDNLWFIQTMNAVFELGKSGLKFTYSELPLNQDPRNVATPIHC